MSDEPVAKRTRLCMSHSQDIGGVKKAAGELKVLHKTMVSKCEVLMCQILPRMNKKINKMENSIPITKLETRDKLCDIGSNVSKIKSHIKSAQKLLNTISQHIDYISIDTLHSDGFFKIDGECIPEMQEILLRDPLSLERKRGTGNCRRPPLHDAADEGHVKCVKFLLERGADVTSLSFSPKHDTILHTLYNSGAYSCDRRDILKMLLDHGVACMFSHNRAADFSIEGAFLQFAVDEVNLLLQHGATLNGLEDHEEAKKFAWNSFQIPMLKLLFLHWPDLYIAPSDICQTLVQLCYKKMILSRSPLDESHEKLLEALKFYKILGGKFCVSPSPLVTLDEDMMQYLKRYKHRRHFKGAKSRIKAIISNPLSLKEISRLAVHKCIRKDYLENIKLLELPEDLLPFLRFDDFTVIKHPEYFDESCDASSDGEDGEDTDDDY